MSRMRWWSAFGFSLATGVVGTGLTGVLWLALVSVVSTLPEAVALWATMLVPPLYDLAFAAPGMLLVGAAGGYVLVRRSDAGATPERLRSLGFLGGLILGVLTPPVAWAAVVGALPDLFSGAFASGTDAGYFLFLLPRMGLVGGLAGGVAGGGGGAHPGQ